MIGGQLADALVLFIAYEILNMSNLQLNSLNLSYLPQLNVKPPSSELTVQNLVALTWQLDTSFTICITVIL